MGKTTKEKKQGKTAIKKKQTKNGKKIAGKGKAQKKVMYKKYCILAIKEIEIKTAKRKSSPRHKQKA